MDEDPLDAIATRCKAGDLSAMPALLDGLREDLLGLVQRSRLAHHDREDACQHAILVLLRCVKAYDSGRGRFRAYVCASVRNMLRGYGRGSMLRLDEVQEPAAPERSADVAELLAAAPHAAIVRRYFGLDGPAASLNQIAAEQGMTPQAVRAALLESLRVMRGETWDDLPRSETR